jgi:hypothetical protein
VLLTKTERNALFVVVQDEGFSPRDFDVKHGGLAWMLKHRAWGDWISIFKSPGGPASLRMVGDEEPSESRIGGFQEAPQILRRWLKEIKTNHETPDLWEDLGEGTQIVALMEDQANTPFSKEEQDRIAEVLAEVIRQARETYGLPEDQLRLLEAKLDYLVEAAPHSRRIDWLNTAIGAVAGAFAGGVLTPDVVQKVFCALGAGLGPLFGHPLPGLGP